MWLATPSDFFACRIARLQAQYVSMLAVRLCADCNAVFYEELVERPESVAVQLLSACGLPWEPGVLKFHDINRPVQTASMEQVGRIR